VAQARADGVALESLYLELLAPAARHLGHLWTEDLVSFTEVSTGLCRLHQLLHEITPVFGDDLEISQTGRRILLAPCVGEQHTFGLVMVAEVFRRSGWQVWGDLPMSRQDLMRIVRAEWFDAVGLSAGSESRLSVLATLVEDVRMESRNTQVAVLVGGPIFVDRPDLAQEIGADGTAQDARVAPVMAEQFVLRREGRI
jgi:methanogenic corrinoid protein MtbC1